MKTNILTLVITLAVGIILAGSLLGPVISDAQNTIGPEVTLTNDSPIVLREIKDGDVLECVRTVTDGTATDVWTLNGETVVGPSGGADAWNVGIMSDGIYLNVYGASNAAIGAYAVIDSNATSLTYLNGGGSSGSHYGFVFEDGDATIYSAYGTETQTVVATAPYTWGYVVCPYGEGEYCAPISGGVGLVNNSNQVILCGVYSTGDFDATYYYVNGDVFIGNTDYTISVDIDKTLHDGTTDIYDATVSVNVSDGTDTETFTPYRILIPYEVTGHEAGGASYTLLGAIPIMVIVALLMAAVGAIALRRAD